MAKTLNKFFDEWQDNKRLFRSVGVGLSACMIIITHWVSSTFLELKPISDIFFGLMMAVLIIAVADHITEKNKLVSFVYAGRSWKNLWQSFLIGGVVGFILFNIGFVLGFASIPTANIDWVTAFVFILIVAVYTEEALFRGVLMPIIYLWLNNTLGYKNRFLHGVLATIMVSGVFAFYHYSILGLSAGLWIPFIFGVIATVGNYWRKSIFFGMGLHFALNFLFFVGVYGI